MVRLSSVHPLEQHLESGLLKVVIGSNGFLHRACPHGRKGDTVGERPFFVRPRRKQGHALLEKFVRWQQDLDVLQLFEAVQKRSETPTPVDPGKGITNLSQNPSCREDLPVPLAAELRGGLVVRITRIEQRNEEKSVAEGALHDWARFGVP